MITVLMCRSQVFREVAYKGRDKEDFLAGIDEFMEQVTVLPPGEWDPKIRLEPPGKVPSQVRKRTCILILYTHYNFTKKSRSRTCVFKKMYNVPIFKFRNIRLRMNFDFYNFASASCAVTNLIR